MFRFTSLALACLSTVGAAPMDWVGKYTEPLFGEGLNVCVDLVGGEYHGQGLLSSLGYMRGKIVGNVWTGDYWLAGFEGRMGHFRLALGGGLASYDGYLTENPGRQNMTTSGTRTSSSMPTDMECFRTDSEYLVDGATYDLTGHYTQPAADNEHWYFIHDGTTHTSSYTYTADSIPGTSYGPVYLNGQVSLDNWYEAGLDEGIELIVAKNATTFYNLWWFAPRVSEVDYSTKEDDNFGIFINYLNPMSSSLSTDDLTDLAESSNCYILWTEDMEEDCFESGSDDDNEDHDLIIEMLGAVLAFSLIGLLMLGGVIYLLQKAQKEPLAGAAAASDKL